MLTQTGDTVTGTFDGDVASGPLSAPIALSGSVDSSRTLRLQGSQAFQDVFRGVTWVGQPGVEFDQWMTIMDDAGTSITGGFRETVQAHFYLAPYATPIGFQSEIVSLSRSPSTP
jgi:hypothetical protein